MEPQAHISVAGVDGFLFFAIGELPYLAFVPKSCLAAAGHLDRNSFLQNRWPYANLYANPKAAGSHIWPDLNRPASLDADGIEVFLERLSSRIRGFK